ncbi:hypothetical protein ACXU4B_10775 [Dyella soli]|uniref:DUF998 domain-containing protein n=1 Tax=Dyella soli TaxID=522319 RepID=A0A4R0YNE3_9GAMM|nr:hypothetical protein [Dyella soli]TCI07339.1 hypothetical protein EZM97_32645 [Dyella soli]
MDRPLKLLTLSLLCLGLALLLPSVTCQVLGSPVELPGWQAAYAALGLGGAGLVDAIAHPAGEAWRYLGLVLAATMNLSFVLAAIVLASQRRSEGTLRRLLAGVALGLVFAVIAPWLPDNPHVSVLAGYYVWLVAYALLFAAVVSAWRRPAPRVGLPASA